MGYKVPDWKKSIDQNKFDVEVGSKKFRLVKPEYLTGVQAERLSKSGEIDGGVYTVMDEICSGLGTAFKSVPTKFFNEFFEAWQADAGSELGESTASSGS